MTDPQMPARMKIGEGRISGAVSIVFGAIALGGVLCFHFPEALTTPEFREQYEVGFLRSLLGGCLFLAYACALRSLIARHYFLAERARQNAAFAESDESDALRRNRVSARLAINRNWSSNLTIRRIARYCQVA